MSPFTFYRGAAAVMAVTAPLRKRAPKPVEKTLDKARSRDSLRAFDNLTAVVDAKRRIVADPPLIVPLRNLAPEVAEGAFEDQLPAMLASYRRTLKPDQRRLHCDPALFRPTSLDCRRQRAVYAVRRSRRPTAFVGGSIRSTRRPDTRCLVHSGKACEVAVRPQVRGMFWLPLRWPVAFRAAFRSCLRRAVKHNK